MTTPIDPLKSGNVYFNDPESGAEMVRLLEQDRLITQGMGGLLPERSNDFSGIQRVLDAACGPGGWVQAVAIAHREIEVVGVDISQAMIDHARMQAQGHSLDNARFMVMNLLQPLDFPDSSFDLVNARFINFLPAAAWTRLLQEFRRIARPGGIIRLTESEWWYYTNSPALEHLNALIIRALKLQGGSFSERFTGVLPMLGRFLLDAGCININYQPHVIDYSFGTAAYQGFRQDAAVVFKSFQPFIVRMGVATQKR